MSCKACGQTPHARVKGCILTEAGINVEDFYACAFVLKSHCLQQHETPGLVTEEPPQQDRPLSIGSLLNKDTGLSDTLGENLLDSFALIFSGQASDGVAATALMQEKQHRFTLFVARNDTFFEDELGHLRKGVESAFTHGFEKDEEKQNGLWKIILRISCRSVCRSLILACKGGKWRPTIGKFQKFLQDTLTKKGQTYYHQAAEELLSIITVLQDEIGVGKASEESRKGNAVNPQSNCPDEKVLRPLGKAMDKSFHLLESCSQTVNSLWVEWGKAPQNSRDCHYQHSSGAGDSILRLFYMLANYRRAYYDIRRLSEEHRKINLQIEFMQSCDGFIGKWTITKACIMNAADALELRKRTDQLWPYGQDPRMNTETCDDPTCSCRTPSPAASQEEIAASDQSPCEDCRDIIFDNLENRERLETWIHCEMQILQYVLTSCKRASFYNYIGCSKGPCWLCHHTLINMTSDFKMRKPHLKVCAAWHPPDFPNNRARFKEVLRALNGEMLKLAKGKDESTNELAQPDIPDATVHFQSPRTKSVPMRREKFDTAQRPSGKRK